jgi:hypothetical protein
LADLRSLIPKLVKAIELARTGVVEVVDAA